MLWYSRSKEDFRDLLIKKYAMKVKDTDFVLISTPDCYRCKYIRPKLEEWCNKNWYKFKEMPYSDKLTEITSVPSAMIWKDVIIDYDWIIELITNKRKFY